MTQPAQPTFDFINLMQNRRSTPLLTTPSPSEAQWQECIKAGMSAPDHGKLKPWRFMLVAGDERKTLGRIFLESLEAQGSVSEQQAERTKNLLLRAPEVLVVAAKVDHEHKIPAVEQLCAVATAAQNIQLALTSLGYGCMWRTGGFASDPHVMAAFDLDPADEIIGFLYVGTPEKQPPERELQSLDTCFSQWKGPTQ